MSEKISIIIPAYNSSKSINKCIDSIISQTYKNLEIIILNDGSKDNTLDIIENSKKKDNRIKVIDKANTGVANTRNHGIKVSTGEYLMFVDSDDYIDRDYIENMYIEMVENNSDVIISGMTSCKENGQIIQKISYKNKNENLKLEDITEEIINKLTFCSACKTLFKKELILKNKIYFNEELKYCEDMLFSFNTLLVAKKIRYINNTGYYYVLNENSATNKTDLKAIYKYCEDNVYALNYIKDNINCQEYLISNRLISKINIAIKKLINLNDINYKLFKKEAITIYTKYIKNTNVDKNINFSKINYESKINLLLIKKLSQKKYFTYYYILKFKKLIKH